LILRLVNRSVQDPGGSPKIKQLSNLDSCFFLYIHYILLRLCKPVCKPENRMSETIKIPTFTPIIST
ncbi:hypothetical protein, partial [uncultured Bacteroides sp.]|uniref:hypothetical protein n=1 Tax=uncultured Bacteroides sp. TaxID=162156 RepID=UPI002674D7C9